MKFSRKVASISGFEEKLKMGIPAINLGMKLGVNLDMGIMNLCIYDCLMMKRYVCVVCLGVLCFVKKKV